MDKIKKFLIVMNDYDDFILELKQDINRPNNPDDDELVSEYMNDNHYGHSYKVIDLHDIELLSAKSI